ncbi:MAG: hypothetical protein AB7F65_04645 [Dehalococcoidia bacterium]
MRIGLALSLLVLLVSPACFADKGDAEDGGAAGAGSVEGTFSDPWAYCAAVGTVDAPDEHYAGEAVPVAVAEGIRFATGASADAPLEFFTTGTTWRCMDGEVYACTVGANLPCDARAETSDQPTQEMVEFCRADPQADAIPAVVTGRETVFAWVCEDGAPVADAQVFHPDERGYLAEIWYELDAPAGG